MSNISTIATYLARFSGQLQPMLEKVQGMDRRTFLLETAALLALTSCSEPSGKAGMAPMISFKPSGVPVVKRSPRQCWRNVTSGRCSCLNLLRSAAVLPE